MPDTTLCLLFILYPCQYLFCLLSVALPRFGTVIPTAEEFHMFGLPNPILRFFIMMEFFAPPVFFFFIAEGYRYTHSKKNYFIRLLVMTLVTQIPYVLFHTYDRDHIITFDFLMLLTNWNVIATLLLGFVAYELLMLLYVLYMSGFSILGLNWSLFIVFSLPIIIITLFYNGEKGHFPKLSKYFFYFFYPAHLLLIYVVKILYKV